MAEAVAHWQAALEATPELHAARVGLGELHLMQGRPAEAEALLAGLEATPDGMRAAVPLRARLHLQRREYGPVRAQPERAVADSPWATEPRRLLGYVLLQEDRDRPAVERALRDLLALAPDDAEARHNLAVLLAKQGRAPAEGSLAAPGRRD